MPPSSRPWSRHALHPSEVECCAAVLCFVLGLLSLHGDRLGITMGRAVIPVLVLVAGALALTWLVRALLLLLRWQRRKRELVEHKAAWALLPVLIAVSWGATLITPGTSTAFDSDRWQSAGRGSGAEDRWLMVEDLRTNHLGRGMSRAEVISRLGLPEVGDWQSDLLRYWLRAQGGQAGNWWLELRFEADALKTAYVLPQ